MYDNVLFFKYLYGFDAASGRDQTMELDEMLFKCFIYDTVRTDGPIDTMSSIRYTVSFVK